MTRRILLVVLTRWPGQWSGSGAYLLSGSGPGRVKGVVRVGVSVCGLTISSPLHSFLKGLT